MTKKLNILIRFWQEFKRRKVFGVVTTYAASAYIIIEVINNLLIPLHLPDWVPTLILVILLIGLPVSVILSWIFDITPHGITKTVSFEESVQAEPVSKPAGKRKLKASYILNAILIIAVIILAYPKIFRPDNLKKIRSAGEPVDVVVMPFQNLTNDTIWNVWQEGIQNELISNLTNSEELKVREYSTVANILQNKGIANYASITPAVASTISQRLGADVYIQGDIKQAGDRLRVTALLVDSKTKENLKSFQIDEPAEEKRILQIVDTLSAMVKNFLIISDIKKKNPDMESPLTDVKSPEAYRYYVYGLKAFSKFDYSGAIRWYSQAIAIDSNFFDPMSDMTWAYMNLGLIDSAKHLFQKLYSRRDRMSMAEKNHADLTNTYLYGTLEDRVKLLKQLVEVDEKYHFLLGNNYLEMKQYDLAVAEYEKNFEIDEETGIHPWLTEYLTLGDAYHNARQYKKEKDLYKKAKKEFPDRPGIIRRQASLSLIQGDTAAAGGYIRQYIRIRREGKVPELMIKRGLADIYLMGGNIDKAEILIRNEVIPFITDDAGNADFFNIFAWFLIDNNRNVNDGLTLIDRALKFYPDNPQYIDTKGWGLYKLGKYQEALTLIQKSADLLLPEHDETIDAHLETVKKAIADQK